jgi:hypothetical protein
MREFPSVSERPAGGIPTTNVTNELARAVSAMAPIIEGGQWFPPSIGGGSSTLPSPQYEGDILMGVAPNTLGFALGYAINVIPST